VVARVGTSVDVVSVGDGRRARLGGREGQMHRVDVRRVVGRGGGVGPVGEDAQPFTAAPSPVRSSMSSGGCAGRCRTGPGW
jgi:hypothetical protein